MTSPVTRSVATAIPADDPGLADTAHEWKSAYVHIPFCRRRCPYCDFTIVDESVTTADHDRYVAAVVEEIAMEHAFGPLDAVNLGGGTPSTLSAEQLATVVDVLRRRFGLNEGAEVSIEINPEDWSDEFGVGLIEAGFTRISIGAQSMDGEILGVLGREHSAGQVESAVVGARTAGFGSVSCDVIMGHPSESTGSWRRTVSSILELPVDHVSTYALTVEPGTQLWRDVRRGTPEPDEDIQADRYEAFCLAASEVGLARYEVSNHAQPGHVCRYNLATWAHAEYLGFGVGAHDHRWGTRSRNHRRIERYLDDVEHGRRPRLGVEHLSAAEQERDRLMLGLRLAAGTPVTAVAQVFVDSVEAHRLVDAGVMDIRDGRIVVVAPFLADAVSREALSVTARDC